MWLFANLLAEVGRLKESLATMQRLLAIEPLVPVYNINAAEVMWENGKDEDAIAMMASAPPFPARVVDLAEIYASMGRYTLAADQLMNTPAATFFPGILKEADRLLRAAPASTNPSPAVPHLGRLDFVYLYVGAPLRTLEFHEDGVDAGYTLAVTTAVLWHRSYAAVRKTERFKKFAGKAGLVEYWRAKGWPALCHPVGATDFACV